MRISKDIGLGWLGLALCAPLVLFGCGRYRARATVTATPRMAYVQPGVWVVANQPDAVFYANGAYWRYDGGVWYQSTYLGGWAPAPLSVVPHAVVRIDRPRRYRGYRLPRGARIRPAPRAHVAPRGPAVRVRRGGRHVDHRERRRDRRRHGHHDRRRGVGRVHGRGPGSVTVRPR
ncbi:MAG: hypothetical protein H6719_17900 [Sandaracinaceae bacterium]|nr:hypothetical protein [Sandaracinaceae bacterium]